MKIFTKSFILLIAAGNYVAAQGWVGVSGTNTLYGVNSLLSTTPLSVEIGTSVPIAQFHTISTVRFQGLSGTGNRLTQMDASGNLSTLSNGTSGQFLTSTGTGYSWTNGDFWGLNGNAPQARKD